MADCTHWPFAISLGHYPRAIRVVVAYLRMNGVDHPLPPPPLSRETGNCRERVLFLPSFVHPLLGEADSEHKFWHRPVFLTPSFRLPEYFLFPLMTGPARARSNGRDPRLPLYLVFKLEVIPLLSRSPLRMGGLSTLSTPQNSTLTHPYHSHPSTLPLTNLTPLAINPAP